jgi:large subunit ribosomal protein L22
MSETSGKTAKYLPFRTEQDARKTAADLPPDYSGYRARGRFVRASADKVRIMGRAVIGLKVERALDILSLSPTKAARLLYQLVQSATQNANRNFEADLDKLKVHRLYVDQASTLKRYHPCAHGRAKPILKRSCHITVQLRLDQRAKRA